MKEIYFIKRVVRWRDAEANGVRFSHWEVECQLEIRAENPTDKSLEFKLLGFPIRRRRRADSRSFAWLGNPSNEIPSHSTSTPSFVRSTFDGISELWHHTPRFKSYGFVFCSKIKTIFQRFRWSRLCTATANDPRYVSRYRLERNFRFYSRILKIFILFKIRVINDE